MKEKWKEVLAVVIAWGVIFAGLGVMYGFSPMARDLAIGIGGGVALGILVGIIVVNGAKPLPKEATVEDVDYYSLWGLMSKGINTLNENGTRMVVLSVLVTILLTFTPILPTPAGGVIGFLGANFFATQIGYWAFIKQQNALPKKPPLVDSLKSEVSRLKKTVARLDAKVNPAESQGASVERPRAEVIPEGSQAASVEKPRTHVIPEGSHEHKAS